MYNPEKGQCQVVFLVHGESVHLPVFPDDKCHIAELDMEVEQIRYFVEDPVTGQPATKGVVKVEYPASLDKK